MRIEIRLFAVFLAASVISPSVGSCATKYNFATSPNGEFASWCRTPAHYWLTRFWKIPKNLVLSALGPSFSLSSALVGQKCALGTSDGRIIFDGVLEAGKVCSGTWSGGGTRFVEACGGDTVTLYLLPERKALQLTNRFRACAEKDASTMYLGRSTPDHRIEVLKVLLPNTEPLPAFNSKEAFHLAGFDVRRMKVCRNLLKIAFEQRTNLFPKSSSPSPMEANSIGLIEFDVSKGTEVGLWNYPLSRDTYETVNQDLCIMGN